MRKKRYEKTVGILLSDETYQRLIRITDEKEIPLSAYIREVLEEHLQTQEKEDCDE